MSKVGVEGSQKCLELRLMMQNIINSVTSLTCEAMQRVSSGMKEAWGFVVDVALNGLQHTESFSLS